MNRKLSILFVGLLISQSLSPHYFANWDHKQSGEKVLIAGATAAVIGGLTYLIYKLLTREPSNERVLQHAQQTYDALSMKYQTIGLTGHVQGTVPIKYTEQDLAIIAEQQDMLILASVSTDIRSLQQDRDLLRTRINRDGAKGGALVEDMRTLVDAIKQLEQKLQTLDAFWQEYKPFFILYRSFHQLLVRYEDIRAIDVFNAEQVRRMIMTASVNVQSAYPYLNFIETLKYDLDGLRGHMGAAKLYEIMHGKAERLSELLAGVLSTAVILPEYQEELHLQKQHQLEQERVNAMREAAAAEREKAAAEREKAYAMHETALATFARPSALPAHVTVQVNAKDC